MKQYKLNSELTDLEKMKGIDPEKDRPKLILKKPGILRRMTYLSNYRDEQTRLGIFIDLIEYNIADKNGRILQHLKF